MQKRRLKIWVPPARCGKKSFGTDWESAVSILRQGSLLHCSARCTEALLALPNDNELLIHAYESKFRCNSFASRRTIPNHWRYAFGRTAGFEPAKKSLEGSRKNLWHTLWNILVHHREGFFNHSLEVTLQAYFTIKFAIFHGKKAANSFIWVRSLIVFSAFRWLNF